MKISRILLGMSFRKFRQMRDYLRNKRQLKTGVPTLEKPDGSRTASASESAEVLADAFSSVYQMLACQYHLTIF